MDFVSQATGTNLCGQCCIAMVSGITLEDAIFYIGHDGKTTGPELEAALTKLNIPHGKFVRGVPGSQSAIVEFLSTDKKRGHWVVYHNGKYYDPRAGIFRQVPRYLSTSNIEAFIPVTPNEAIP